MKNLRDYILFLFLILFTSCTLIPCGWEADLEPIDNIPEKSFFVGTYKLDNRTLNYVSGYRNAVNATLNLRANGTFEIIAVPKATFDTNSYYREVNITVDAKGTWRHDFTEGRSVLRMNLVFNSDEENLTDFHASWKVYEKEKKPIIVIIVGDPDECAAARFEKIVE